MASIFKRQNKKGTTYYIQYYYNGKRYRDKVGKNYEAAQMRLGETVRKIETGQFSLYSDAPIESFMKQYRETLNSQPFSDGSRKRHSIIFNNIEKYFNSQRVRKVNEIDFPLLDNFVTQRVNNDKISPGTANMEIELVKRLFRFAEKHRYLMENPANDLEYRKATKREPRFFSQEEIELLLEKAGKYEPFFMVLLHTGLRGSDAGNLRWSDIDLDRSLIRVVTEKTSQGIAIPMNDTLHSYLLDYGTETPKLFPDLDTDHKRDKVRIYIQKILRNAGYDWRGVGCHAFRHTFASHLVINGASIYDVQKLLGHKSIIMTQIYAHLSENATRRAVDLIDFNPKNVTNTRIKSVINEQEVD